MNHFAHARVAAAHADDPLLALGAMLPDFASMLRERLAEPGHPVLCAGVRLHHASDAAFHAAPEFVAALVAGSARLRELGVARGPARAAAHVGIELCVDAGLAHDRDASRQYRAALDIAALPEIEAWIRWRRDEVKSRWRALHERLSERGAPRPDATSETLAAGVARALASRPRLALDCASEEWVGRWIEESKAALSALSEPLLHRVVLETRLRDTARL